MSGSHSGGCLCGELRFSATPRQAEFGVCHCDMCRRWSGGTFMAVGCGDNVEFEKDSSLRVFASSEWAERGFCGTCGTALFYRLKGAGHYQVALGAFDDISGLEFTSQIFIDEKPDAYEFANDTRKLTGQQVIDAYMAEKTGGAVSNG